MTPVRAGTLALVHTRSDEDGSRAAILERDDPEHDVRERRAFTRFDPLQLADPPVARVKYGDAVRLVDVSAGGALFETSMALRPESTVVLEMTGGGAQESISVVSRVLRCHVSHVRGGLRYRGACAFKRPLEHPGFLAPLSWQQTVPPAFARPEFALKAIVEAYRRRRRVAKTSARTLIDALASLRESAEQRSDEIDRRVAEMLAGILPLLERQRSAEDLTGEVLVQLARHIPALTIRVGGARSVAARDAERVTLNVWPKPLDRAMLTAEYPAGFEIDESQFRLLKAGAYLLGLAESWKPGEQPLEPVAAAPDADPSPKSPPPSDEPKLPAGWQRIVVRFADGELLRGYCNNFFPDAAHLHLSPDLNCTSAERLLVPMVRLKAVFFVRSLVGNPEQADSNEFDHAPRARKVQVTFRDGEVMVGSTLNYKPGGQGFVLNPANSGGNNERVYVVLASVRHVRFL